MTNGEDVRFEDPDGTALSYQIERWDSAGQLAEVWVRVPQVDGNSNTDHIKMYWGKAGSTSASSANDTFRTADNYQAVYRFPSTNSFNDSTANNNHGANSTTPATTQVTGHIGFSRAFTDSSFIQIPHSTTLHCTSCTLEAWYYLDVAPGSWTSDQPRIWDKNWDWAPSMALERGNGCGTSNPTFRLTGMSGSQRPQGSCGVQRRHCHFLFEQRADGAN